MEIRGTQMAQEGLVSSDEELKDAFREKEKTGSGSGGRMGEEAE